MTVGPLPHVVDRRSRAEIADAIASYQHEQRQARVADDLAAVEAAMRRNIPSFRTMPEGVRFSIAEDVLQAATGGF